MNDLTAIDLSDASILQERQEHGQEVETILGRIASIADALEDEAGPSEDLGKLTDRAVDLIFSSGVTQAYIPKDLGGIGLYPGEALPLMQRIARIDGSIGWVNTIFVSSGLLVNYLDAAVSEELLGSDENISFSAVSNGQGVAVKVEDGWKLSGSYRYASGIKHAQFVFMPAMKMVDGNALPPPAGMGFFLVPTSSLQLHEGWDVLGLKATGSVDISVKDVLVPANFECQIMAPPQKGGRAAAGGIMLLIPIMHLGFALGMAERLLDEMKPIANKKPPMPGAASMGEKETFRIEYAKMYVEARAAKALVTEVMADIDDSLRRGERLSTRQQSMLKAVNIHAHDVLRNVANWAFQRAGGAALRGGSLQRNIRDALAGCQHFIASDAHYANVGFDLIGAPENYGWLGLHQFGPLPTPATPDRAETEAESNHRTVAA